MKFIFFLASTMLIVSISQCFPLNETTEQPCSVGFERINGQCVPISSTTNANTMESSSFPTVTMIMPVASTIILPVPIMNACPPGTTRGQNGRCERIELSTTTQIPLESSSMESLSTSFPDTTMITPEVTSVSMLTTEEPSVTTLIPEVTTVVVDVSEKSGKIDVCPPGTIRGQNGRCESTELFTTTEIPLESSSIESSSFFTTTMITPEVTTIAISGKSKKSEDCPPGSILGKNDECEPIEPMTTAEAEIETTTELQQEESRKPINLMRCPEGTKRDDDGACQEIVRVNQTKTTDPKIFLKKDGSCPDGYKKINGQCSYIESKQNATLIPGESFSQDRLQPKSGSDEGSNLNTLVRTNEDGSCPTGTQHYETGLCMVVNQPLAPALNSKVTCGDAYELVNGKCIRKGLTEPDQLEPSKDKISVATEQSNTDDKLVEPTQSNDSENEDKPVEKDTPRSKTKITLS